MRSHFRFATLPIPVPNRREETRQCGRCVCPEAIWSVELERPDTIPQTVHDRVSVCVVSVCDMLKTCLRCYSIRVSYITKLSRGLNCVSRSVSSTSLRDIRTKRIIINVSTRKHTSGTENEQKCHSKANILDNIHNITDKISTNIPISVLSILAATLPSVIDIPSVISQALLGGVYICVGVPSIVHNLLEARGSRDNALRVATDVHTLMTLSAFSALAIDKAAEGAFLLGLFQLAHAVEHCTVASAARDVDGLARLVPDMAQVVMDPPPSSPCPSPSSLDGPLIQNMKCTAVPVGSIVLIRPHSICPLDGVLLTDTATVNVSHITGESAGINKMAGGAIPAGAINVSSHAILIQTTKTSQQSALQRIVFLAQSAARSRPGVATLFDTYMPYYTTAVLGTTTAIGVTSTAFLGLPSADAVYHALTFLVASSPCALLVSSPVAMAAAVSSCSRRGIVLSGGGRVLERFATARTLALDKTGTITKGHLVLSGIHMLSGKPTPSHDNTPPAPTTPHPDSESPTSSPDMCRNNNNDMEHENDKFLLQLASALATHGSRHPVSQAIARSGAGMNTSRGALHESEFILVVDSVKETPGKGVEGVVKHIPAGTEWKVVIGRYCGDGEAIKQLPLEGSLTHIRACRLTTTSTCNISSPPPAVLECVVSMSDTVRVGIKESLRNCQVPTVMLTGDNHATAMAIGSAVGMKSTQVFSELTPEDKAAKVASLDQVLMVGDGVNDAPALAAAPAGGVAVASPSSGDSIHSAAVSVADAVILLPDEGTESSNSGSDSDSIRTRNPVEAANFLILKSKQTRRIVKQNVGIALVSIVGTAGMVVVHGCPLWIAVLFHEGSTVLVVLNGLRNLYP